ncbi:ABC-2 transporter permease [Thermosediminibacter oceani]|uniref:ABC-2 transporter permease n=1 Tax=Thermosediminibacter oceani (strain ATCC BAA-1034 / DSM 16646 / JW/IW-1228P) TaxID=555079 RepID=D9S110_THEOJ|nr:ABC-2 transporter permease [Thermosediminibacter oceani]ADL07174.1 hypothetical protein Toce_0393 [Thermosediminibacter oceani DSM 16646]
MLTLIYKEFLITRITLIFYIVISLLYNFNILSPGPPLPLVTMLATFFQFMVAGQEDKNNSHIFINSLPVTRKQVVVAKYLFSILVGLLLIGLTVVIQWLMPMYPSGNGFVEIIYAVSAICFFTAAFYPLYFWLGAQFVRIGIFAFFIFVFAVAPILVNIAMKKNCWGILGLFLAMPDHLLAALVLGMTIVLMVISAALSIRIYGRKDF